MRRMLLAVYIYVIVVLGLIFCLFTSLRDSLEPEVYIPHRVVTVTYVNSETT